MPITAKPEILAPPRRRLGGHAFDDEHLDLLSHLLDDFLRIPGTPIRFGLDGIVGFIPGIGDILGGLASSIIIIAAWVRDVPKVTLTRMVINVAIETAAGAVPVLGNLFDIGWKANRRNYALLDGIVEHAGAGGSAELAVHRGNLRGAGRADGRAGAAAGLGAGACVGHAGPSLRRGKARKMACDAVI